MSGSDQIPSFFLSLRYHFQLFFFPPFLSVLAPTQTPIMVIGAALSLVIAGHDSPGEINAFPEVINN